MIVDSLERRELSTYNLGGINPSKEVVEKLKEVDKRLEAIFDKDSGRWEIYLCKIRGPTTDEDKLYWQNSAPTCGGLITPAIATWLRKFDTSKGSRYDDEDRQKHFLEDLKIGFEKLEKLKQKNLEEQYYIQNDLTNYITRMAFGTKQVHVPIAVGVTDKGKTVRAYPKKDQVIYAG